MKGGAHPVCWSLKRRVGVDEGCLPLLNTQDWLSQPHTKPPATCVGLAVEHTTAGNV